MTKYRPKLAPGPNGPTYREMGYMGSAARWSKGENRTRAFIGDLSVEQRQAVLDLLARFRAENAKP